MKSTPPLVSVIIPAYNAARHIGETIGSILDQTLQPCEIIVVDDGSTDTTGQVLQTFGDAIRVICQKNGGLGCARNRGMEEARGDYCAWLDADDLCHPQRLAVQAAYLDANPAIGAISTGFSAFNEQGIIVESYADQYYSALRSPQGAHALYATCDTFDGNVIPWLTHPFESPYTIFSGDIRDTIVWGNFIHPPTLMMRRSLFQPTGRLDDTFGIAVDWEYFIRLAQHTRFAFIDAPLLHYRMHAAQMSSDANTQRLATDILRVMESVMRRHPDLAIRFPQKTRRVQARSYLRVARELAETGKWQAFFNLCRSLRLHPCDRRAIGCLIKILLPRRLVQLFRRIRAGTTSRQ